MMQKIFKLDGNGLWVSIADFTDLYGRFYNPLLF